MKIQSTEAKKGEIEFRRKLVQQEVGGTALIADEPDKAPQNKILTDRMSKILTERMTKTYKQISVLRSKGIPISPYAEIGAERGQRSLVLENDLDAAGAAVDISFDMLKSCEYFAKIYNRKKLPLRICADANNLPFLSNTVPFFYCYQTLHHFPTPVPIVEEIHRVLTPGGSMFFDEEPFRKVLHLNLYVKEKSYSTKALNRSGFKKALDYLFAAPSCDEVEYGIIENDKISLKEWKNAFKPFSERNVSLTSARYITTPMYPRKNPLLFPIAYLLGGSISALCRKAGQIPTDFRPITETLMCPACREIGSESGVYLEGEAYKCRRCGISYPIHEGILFLFTPEKLRELYPERSIAGGKIE